MCGDMCGDICGAMCGAMCGGMWPASPGYRIMPFCTARLLRGSDASANLTTRWRAPPGRARVPLSALQAACALSRCAKRTNAQPLDRPSFSRIMKTSSS